MLSCKRGKMRLLRVSTLILPLCAWLLTSASFSRATVVLPNPKTSPSQASNATFNQLIPMPVSVTPGAGTFSISETTRIVVDANNDDLLAVGQYLADHLRSATGFELPVVAASDTLEVGQVRLTILSDASRLVSEAYELTVSPDGITLSAATPEGVFRGVQTIRQLLPPSIESGSVQPGPWNIPAVTISDYPRYEWRGMMLDVARHFFAVDDIKQIIDLLALYKMNRLHLHLADDQGWRIEIKSWPDLTRIGATTAVNGDQGGYYTQEEYAEIVAYANSRYITIVPEIDMPGHTNAALASYPDLNCSGEAPDLYTGTEVGFSSLCIGKEITYQFVDDVVRELAALTTGPYIHIGGDEAKATSEDDYIQFVERVQDIVTAHGKQMVGWEEIAKTDLLPSSVPQYWWSGVAQKATAIGAKMIVSPANKAYIDMKYDETTDLGLTWAATISVRDAYNWDPAAMLNGVTDENILGVEAPLWSETLVTLDDIEYMAFPRLLGYAEMGWTPADQRDWDTYKVRLGAQGPRLRALGVNFYEADGVDWQ